MIGILNILKYVLPLGIQIMLYNSLILPHIKYCIMAWGYKGIRLLKIQKQAVRIITLSGNVITFMQDVIKPTNAQELKFYFKMSYKPACLIALGIYFKR